MALPRQLTTSSCRPATWLARSMHTPSRQIPNLPTPSTSPHNPHDPHSHHQTLTMPSESSHLLETENTSAALQQPTNQRSGAISRATRYTLPPALHSPHPTSTHTPKGKLIPTRLPASTTAPTNSTDKTSPSHPLWKFFRSAEGSDSTLYPLGGMGLTLEEIKNLPKVGLEGDGSGLGSLEAVMENDRNLKSGESALPTSS